MRPAVIFTTETSFLQRQPRALLLDKEGRQVTYGAPAISWYLHPTASRQKTFPKTKADFLEILGLGSLGLPKGGPVVTKRLHRTRARSAGGAEAARAALQGLDAAEEAVHH